MKWIHVAAIGVAGWLAASPAGAVTFSFDGLVGTQNDFSIVAEGLTATFSSTSGPGTFAVAQPVGLFTFPVALGNYGSFGGDALTITFSSPSMDRILIPFGIVDPFATTPPTLTVRADTGQTVSFTSAFNTLVSGAPEGVVTFFPLGRITSLTLTSDMAFAIASVEVPEPMSAAILAAGVVGVAGARANARRGAIRAAIRRGWRRLPAGSARSG